MKKLIKNYIKRPYAFARLWIIEGRDDYNPRHTTAEMSKYWGMIICEECEVHPCVCRTKELN